MIKIKEFIRRERLYILLLVFVAVVNVIAAMPGDAGRKTQAAKAKAELSDAGQERHMTSEEIEAMLRGKKYLAWILSLASLLILATLILGLVIDAVIVSSWAAKRRLNIRTQYLSEARWDLWDVARVVILFIFFGYVIIIIEALAAGIFPILKNNNFRMVANSSVLDVLGVVFILYFTHVRYKERLVALGISFKNFLKNVSYGIIGYVAILPILAGILISTSLVADMIKYVPAKQMVVELFLKEKNAAFLLYTSLFAAILGPIIEELFFRGFMYGALKKYTGAVWAAVISASAFAFLHAHVVGFLPILVLGILLVYLYEKTGTLISSITLHMTHNLSMVLMVFLTRQVKGV